MTFERISLLLLTVVFVGGCTSADSSRSGREASSTDDPKSAWITKLSGRYEIDPADSEKSVVAVNLGRTDVDDSALAGLKLLPKVRRLELAHSKVGDTGLEHVASLKDLQTRRSGREALLGTQRFFQLQSSNSGLELHSGSM